ncbi:MAG: cadherin-like domain-containing protein, partial [Sedimenticola sp.]
DVSVSADDVADVSSLSVTISDTSGGGYEQLAVSATSATTEVVDLNAAPVAVDDTGSVSPGEILVSEDFNAGVSGWGDEVSAQGNRMEIGKDETASKTFDFGAEHAGETVTVSFDSQTLGSWDERGSNQDFFTVDANGSEVINTSEKGSESHSFQVTLDESGQLTLELHTDSTTSSERVRIDDLQIVSGDDWSGGATTIETNTLTIDVLANDTDADGDALTITDVSEVFDEDGNVIGTAEVVDNKVEFTANSEYEGLTEGQSVQGSFTYTISDGKGGTDTATATVTVVGEGDEILDLVLSGTTIVENAAEGTVVATLQSIDQSTGDTFSYELVRDDSGHFEIVDDKLVVKEGADIDYESEAIHELSIQVTDSTGNTYTESVIIHVEDVQEVMTATYTGTRKGDRFEGGEEDDVIDGVRGDDKLYGGEGDDVILGGGGEDRLYGDEGNDRLEGGDSRDKLYGGDGDDTLVGGEGKDKMYGGDGHDTFIGGEGKDKMYGGDGHDRFYGGEGDDTAKGEDGSDTYVADAFGGSDYFSGGEGGGWTDVIQLNADAVPAGSDPDAPWSIQVDGEQVQYDIADHALSLDPDASGVITFSDGSELTFDGVERIEW